MYRTDNSRSTTDIGNWKIKKRKISEEQYIKKKGYNQAGGKARVNIGAAVERTQGAGRLGIGCRSCVVSI